MQSLPGAEPQDQLAHRRVRGDARGVLHVVGETGSGHHLETFVDADTEFRRKDGNLNGVELRALDLPRDRAQLAVRIDLSLYAAACIPLDGGSEIPDDLVLRFVQ